MKRGRPVSPIELTDNERTKLSLIASRPKGQRTESRRQGRRSASDDSEEEEELAAIVDFDALFLPDSPNIAGLIVPQLAFYDVRQIVLLGTNLWHSQTLLNQAEQYVQGAIFADGFFTKSQSSDVQAFVQHFEETFLEKPGFIEAILYDSAMILLDVIQRPEIQFRGDIRTALFDPNGFRGVTGHTRFDESGEALKRSFLLTIQGSEFVEVDRR